jgi:hypothetical protein
MTIFNKIAVVGMIISITATIIVLYNYCKENHFCKRRRPRRRNQISPEMFHVLARIIQERNNEESKKEIELIPKKKKKFIVVVNPDNKIVLGSENV